MDSRHLRILARTMCAAGLACVAAGAPAQTVHKRVDTAGHITYTDRPDMTPSPGTARDPVSEVAIALAANAPIASPRSAAIDANEAARRVAQLQRERTPGAEWPPIGQVPGADPGAVNARRAQRREALRRKHERAQRQASELGRVLRARQ